MPEERRDLVVGGKVFTSEMSTKDIEAFGERMQAKLNAEREQSAEAEREYLKQKVTCPCCKSKASLSSIARYGDDGYLDYLVCGSCRVHFDPPPRS